MNLYSKKFTNSMVLPLFIYFDELEVGNPLGSHAGTNKFGAPHMAFCLNSFLFSTLVRAEDKNE